MLNIRLTDGKTLSVFSSYDCGNHKGFKASIIQDDYNEHPINTVLTKEQIKVVEAVLASTIKNLIE